MFCSIAPLILGETSYAACQKDTGINRWDQTIELITN